VVLNKRYQRADWGRRPLSTDLLEYARLDSHYLIPLRERLWDDLVRKELDGLALEDFRRSCKVTIPKNGKTTLPCWKISGGQDLTSRQMAVLQALCEFREQFAQSANLPPFKVLTNEALIQLTLNLPESMGDMESVPGLGKRQKLRFGPDLLMAIQRGLNSEPPKRNSKPEKPSDNYLTRLEALRTWRKVTAQKMGVPSDVILPRSALEDVAAANPQTLDELLIISAEHPWRFTHFGQQILDVLGGQLEQ
jgi:ribonuclease D